MNKKSIAVLGGTGSLGGALAWRWARAGHDVIIGSRGEDRAQQAATDLNTRVGGDSAKGMTYADAVDAADIVVIAVPFSAHAATLETIKPHLHGQIVIDTTVPLQPPKVAVVQLPSEGSAALITQAAVGEASQVAAAFHNVAANLLNQDTEIHCDILVTADDKDIRLEVMQLAEEAGCKAINAGKLANSAATEAMTSLLIHINKSYKTPHAGLTITGL